MSSRRIPSVVATLTVLLSALMGVGHGGCDGGVLVGGDDVAERYSITDYPRSPYDGYLDILPVATKYIEDSRYSGISTLWPSPTCNALSVHGYPLDTAGWVIDAWVTTRCRLVSTPTNPNGVNEWYNLLRVFIIDHPERLAGRIGATIAVFGTDGTAIAKHGFEYERLVSTRVANPSEHCLPTPTLVSAMISPEIVVPQVFQCDDNRPDSLRVRLHLYPTVTPLGVRCPPRPTTILYELSNSSTGRVRRSAFNVTACSL